MVPDVSSCTSLLSPLNETSVSASATFPFELLPLASATLPQDSSRTTDAAQLINREVTSNIIVLAPPSAIFPPQITRDAFVIPSMVTAILVAVTFDTS